MDKLKKELDKLYLEIISDIYTVAYGLIALIAIFFWLAEDEWYFLIICFFSFIMMHVIGNVIKKELKKLKEDCVKNGRRNKN